jgi:hypothetical protein
LVPLVHQGNVQITLGILDDLGSFGFLNGFCRINSGIYDGTVQPCHPVQGIRGITRNNLGDLGQGALLVTRIDTFRRIRNEKVFFPG